ncbi:phospho-sugar mutase [Candidatus Saccharibacteria bacterium]|nr:phospho-sugar mutase [Candidatus Saccharibacteria bacterium]
MQNLEGKLSKSAIDNINQWMTQSKYAEYKAQLEAMIQSEAWQDLEDSFFKVIEFGTGGRRGKTGIGSNRINKVTIGESAQALCSYALSFDPGAAKKGIVIAYDTRITSPELSKFTAQVVAANGFKTYIFDSFRATPELSFAVRHLGCIAGIVLSASHNPPSDNGFKAYWKDGGQLVSPHDKGVLAEAAKINQIKSIDFDRAVSDGTITIIGKEVDDAYVRAVLNESMGDDRDINIVYSPLHGTGQVSVLPVLRSAGFKNISIVKEQMVPDGNFPTVPNGKPNPEERPANEIAVSQMMREMADITITNDPDADRIGVMVRQVDTPIYLNGNQSAVLAIDYVLSKMKQLGDLTDKHFIAKTIVTTDMIKALTDYYGARLYTDMLIGFKYIGELILSKENTDEKFVIGGEESYGLLKGTYARDKDAATGALPIAEYAAELKKQGKTLYDRLLELFDQHGIYIEGLDTMYCLGASGFDKMQKIMSELRKKAPTQIGDEKVMAIRDYSSLERLDLSTGEKSAINCKTGDVFVLEFGDYRKRITIRPSGTEPKLKFYVQWYEPRQKDESVSDQYGRLEKYIGELSSRLEKILNTLA